MTKNETLPDEIIIKDVIVAKKTWSKPVMNDLQVKDTFGSKNPSPIKEGDLYVVSS